jgi:hypothetical protein
MPIASPFCNHFKGQPLTNNCEGKGSKTKEIAGNANIFKFVWSSIV